MNSVKPKGGENFFPYSEDFENSDWTKNSGTTITNNYAISPDGTQTAARYLGTGTSGLGDKFTLSVTDYTISFWVKSNNGVSQFCRLIGDSSNISENLLITTEWTRLSYTFTGSGLSNKTNGIFRDSNDNDIDVLIYGAQLERGSLGVYNPTNGTAIKNADFDFTRGSSATRVNEQGLIQDVQILSGELVQNGDFEQIGSELVTNGSFDSSASWGMQSSWSIANGSANYDGISSHYIEQSNVFSANTNYKITFTISNNTSGIISIRDGAAATLVPNTNYTNGTHTFYIKSNTNTTLRIYGVGGSGTLSIDNVSVKEVGQNWTFQNGWNMGDGVAVYSGTVSAYRTIYQENILTVNSKYRLTFDIVSIASGSIENISQSSPTSYNTVGTKTEDFIATSTDLFLKPTTDADLTIDNISVIEVTDDTDLPRINYTNFDYENGEVVPYSGEGSLLLEPQSTNRLLQSNQFDSEWSTTRLDVLANQIISPDGTLNADLLTPTASANSHSIGNATLINYNSQESTISFFAKFNGYNISTSVAGTPTNWTGCVFDLENGIAKTPQNAGAQSLCTSKIENYGNGWYRCSITFTPYSSGTFYNFWGTVDSTDANLGSFGLQSYTADGISGVYLWGCQAEVGQSYPTSYIKTTSAAVTRLADVCNNSGSSDLINSTEGVLYAEISALANDGRISLNDGTTDNNVRFTYQASNNTIFGILYNGSNQAVLIYQLPTENAFYKLAFKYKVSDFSLFVNGIEVDSLTGSGTTFTSGEGSFIQSRI